jgi:hypothetical protein
MSYFEDYYNLEGEKTLRSYSRPLNLSHFDRIGWMTTEEDLWPISDHFFGIRRRPLVSAGTARRLTPMDRRSFDAGKLGAI